jgi:putative phosphoribosyl transferase
MTAVQHTPSDPHFDYVRTEVDIDAGDGLELPGVLPFPPAPKGVVAFAQGSGSSRLRPQNRLLSRGLNVAGLATLLFDLLTLPEEYDHRNIFDVSLLATRLIAATRWLRRVVSTTELALGYLGAGTGAAAALAAVAELGIEIGAVVSHGGRTDLIESCLAEVTAPTLLIVGGHDWIVLEHNRRATADALHDSARGHPGRHIFVRGTRKQG